MTPGPDVRSVASWAPPPAWLTSLVANATDGLHLFGRSGVAPSGATVRRSAVLVLFGGGPAGPDLLLLQRTAGLRSHPGQPAFPGGGVEPGDRDPAATALREAREECGVDPAGVQVLATLPSLWLPPSRNAVSPVIAWWRQPCDVGVADTVEVASVARVPITDLADPAHRVTVRHPSGYVGPAFEVAGMLVWGFTAAIVDRLLALGGFERPWDRDRSAELPTVVGGGR